MPEFGNGTRALTKVERRAACVRFRAENKKKKVITGRWTVNSRRLRANCSDIGEGEESVFRSPFSDFRIPTSEFRYLSSVL